MSRAQLTLEDATGTRSVTVTVEDEHASAEEVAAAAHHGAVAATEYVHEEVHQEAPQDPPVPLPDRIAAGAAQAARERAAANGRAR